ncbi:MAG: ABC transporter substrate-binding protein [Thalassotalea sp.]
MLSSLYLLACSDIEDLSSLTKKSLIYCSEAAPENFNPQTTTDSATIDATSNQIYNSLITINPIDNTLAPSLAKSWHVTKDGKMVTFYLHKNIEFHATNYFFPSRNLNADDVIFSFARMLDPEHEFHQTSTGHYPYFERIGFKRNVEKIEKINTHTVRFHLHEPDASFLAHLATQYAVILSAEYADLLASQQLHKNIDTLPIGTGPFKLKEYRVNAFIRYYQHENYWQNKLPIEQLVYDITTSNTSRLTKLMTGECDIIAEPIGHSKIVEHKNLTLESVTTLDISFLAFNTLEPPFNNALVRKAIAHAIDKKAIINAVYFGHGVQAYSILPPVSWAYNAGANTTYNVNKAVELMAEAGYKDGFEMNLWAPPGQKSYNPNALTMAMLIKEDLKSIGINVNITHEQPEQILGMMTNPNYQAYIHGWTADHPDPDNFFSTLLSCSATETGTNLSFWCHQSFDSLLEKGRQTDKIEQRKFYYNQALKLLNTEMPIVPIAHSKSYMARNNKIEGKFFNSFGVQFSSVRKN